MRRVGMLLLGAILAATAGAQSNKPAPQPIGLAFTWNAVHAPATFGGDFWMQGADFQLHVPLWRGLGEVTDVGGMHTANINSSGVGLDVVTITFGPRYTWSRGKVSLYGQGLAGLAFGFNSAFPAPAASNASANGLAVLAGGGLDVAVRRHFAVRLLEADWLRTQLPNGVTNVENDLRIGAGVTLHFGRQAPR
ncbi:MAG: hypothetical protein ACRD27_09305 [Terracidiphilus sp.]